MCARHFFIKKKVLILSCGPTLSPVWPSDQNTSRARNCANSAANSHTVTHTSTIEMNKQRCTARTMPRQNGDKPINLFLMSTSEQTQQKQSKSMELAVECDARCVLHLIRCHCASYQAYWKTIVPHWKQSEQTSRGARRLVRRARCHAIDAQRIRTNKSCKRSCVATAAKPTKPAGQVASPIGKIKAKLHYEKTICGTRSVVRRAPNDAIGAQRQRTNNSCKRNCVLVGNDRASAQNKNTQSVEFAM